MYSANRFPVMLYEGGPVGYAEGGLHDEALAVRKAGRNGDSRLVHVNDEEFADMVAQYGEPTINPETGMPEFFLGGLGKILKKLAPIAAFAVPVIGPALGTALGVGATAGTALAGAGLGALGGGGLKGAALGALTGGLGASGAPGKIGGALLKQGATQATKNALGQALISGGIGALSGQNPLTSALGGAAQGYFMTPRTPQTAGQPPVSGSPSDIKVTIPAGTANPSIGSASTFALDPATQASINSAAGGNLAPMPTSGAITDYANKLVSGSLPTTTTSYTPSAATQAALDTASARPNWWNRDVGFLGKMGRDLGIKNKHAALVGGLLAAGVIDAAKPKTDTSMPSQEAFFGPSFSQSGLNAPGNFKLASVASGTSPESAAAEYAKKYFRFAAGGDVGGEGRSSRSSFAVRGPGDGRSDEIPAMLSDGEYVIDAETVALLGNGSPKAGAKRLDDLRVKIRKHKGKKLAKGKFSPNAKPAEKYMAGGRI